MVGADLNNDSYDDLIVSSPLYTDGFNSFDQGRVFIFWNNPNNSGMFDWVSCNFEMLMHAHVCSVAVDLAVLIAR